ncbi:S1C family serine protease [Leifsonia naganoensis]|uniref:Putative serine protease PepD n=1 Tax=Leifsonia naganoensis TaxID=150025 RepID=A0A853DV06_9MICO|nr:trypsin-like peptidase domain-containing protein [Leifsonia naganoensis]NYK10381.1 putative serine protease PepD [Leifsonia naganoensis]
MTDQQPTPDPAAAESAAASPVPDPADAPVDAAATPEPPADDPGTPTRAGWATALLVTGAALTLIAGGFIAGTIAATAVTAGTSGSCDAASVANGVLPTIVTISVTSSSGGISNGSGQIITDDGYILTNNHVISPAASGGTLSVRFSDGHDLDARLIGRDPKTDLAVVKVDDDEPLPVISIGDSGGLSVGQPVVALGAPLGLSSTVTAGIVSALGRTVPVPSDDDRNAVLVGAIQTDASINPGNSGGALVDCRGRLIGVNTAIATVPGSGGQSSTGSVGIGFAVPESSAMSIAHELIETGKVSYPTAGLEVLPIPPGVAAAYGITDGLFVQSVEAGGPAASAGLRAGDVVTTLNGTPASSVDVLTAVQITSDPGDEVAIGYVRSGREREATLTLAAG